MRVFVTGGAGYIGSHSVLSLIRAGHDVFIYDNFNALGKKISINNINKILEFTDKEIIVKNGDILDYENLIYSLDIYKPDVVVHFSALKSVTESVKFPGKYILNNIEGTKNLLNAMDRLNILQLVFSSSAAVYGRPLYVPIDELHPVAPISPYANTKMVCENCIDDWVSKETGRSAISLRYFNPAGAHSEVAIGEIRSRLSENLVPRIVSVLKKETDKVVVNGSDYDTRDGTPLRDLIHIEDLAIAHLKATNICQTTFGHQKINVGSGVGATVLETIAVFETLLKRSIPFEFGPRRAGDISHSIAAIEKAKTILEWEPKKTLQDICRSTLFFENII